MKYMKKLVAIASALCMVLGLAIFQMAFAANVSSAGTGSTNKLTCQGKFLNPITDICWSCMFPITLGGNITLNNNNQEDNQSTPGDWFCACEKPTRAGVTVSFWEPTHLVEVVRTPFCMVSLGGISLKSQSTSTSTVNQTNDASWLQKLFGGSHERGRVEDANQHNAFYQVHWYKNPVVFWLEALLDNDCIEQGVLDIGWMTELDPTWKYPTLAIYQAPDSALFANVVAQAACAADCVKANVGFPFSKLYWCAGCHGTLYPLSGWMGGHFSEVQASKLMVARMQAKMHRDLVAWRTSGKDSICGYKLNPLMDKQNYKMAMTYPIAARKFQGKCCEPIGRSTLVRDSGKAFPYKGNQFAYQLFRKRDCCGAYKYEGK